MQTLPFKAKDTLPEFHISLSTDEVADFMRVVGDGGDYADAVSAVAVVSKSIGLLVQSVGKLADGAMHLSEEIEVTQLPRVGSTVRVTPQVTTAKQRGDTALVKINKIFTDGSGNVLLTATSFLSFNLGE